MNIFLHKAVFNWSKENWKGRSTNLMWNRIRTRGKLTSHNWAMYIRVVQISVTVFYMHRDLENTDLWLLVLTFVFRCSLLLNSAVIGKLFSGRTNEANHNYVICLAERKIQFCPWFSITTCFCDFHEIILWTFTYKAPHFPPIHFCPSFSIPPLSTVTLFIIIIVALYS